MEYNANINSITFGVYSPEEVLNMSVCKIDNTKKNVEYGTVYDPRMGNTESKCETCKENAINCPGHFGHIELNEPIVHPLYYKRVLSFLNCFCMKCHGLIIHKDQLYLNDLNKYKGDTKFAKILERVKKIDVCCNYIDEDTICGKDQPDIKFNSYDNNFSMIYEDNKKNKTSVIITTDEINKIFTNISSEDIVTLGLDAELCHPRNFIITNLLVLPPCARPYVKADNKLCDDDLTDQYIEIIKSNNKLIEDDDMGKTKNINREQHYVKKQKALASLRFRILTTFNNGQGKAKHTTNERPFKGIKERLTGKDGQIRNNMMGKRCDQTARTVIGPDPTLLIGELGVPEEIANILTIPVRVCTFNISILQDMIDNGKIKSIIKPDKETVIDIKRFRRGTSLIAGDIIHRGGELITVKSAKETLKPCDIVERNGKILKNVKAANRKYQLEVGWIVNCPLQNGNYVLLNRQPTLHKASMMSMQVVIKPYKTLRMNLAITKPFNADFDGDEMNIHVPQSLEAQAELKYLSTVYNNMISCQSSKPNICIVQDALLGAYKMTQNKRQLTKSQFFHIAMKLPSPPWSKHKGMMCPKDIISRIYHIRRILKEKGKKIQAYNGRGLVSLILPDDFIYHKINEKHVDEPAVKVWRGVLYEGVFDKSIIGASYNSIHQLLNKEYNTEYAAFFLDCIQFCANNYLLVDGFSINFGDCFTHNKPGENKQKEIKNIVKKCYIEADMVKDTSSNKNIKEIRINSILNKAKDLGLKIAKDSLKDDNNFLSTVNSGSKGDFFNIAQISGLLGQQNLKGQRIQLCLNNGKRSLPHYPFDNLTPEMEYESRGFIDNGFLKGLNPRQFFFHAMSGREGISDTAMGTATTGYMQRRIIKLTEDVKIQNDRTVRDVSGKIYQMSYGQMDLDPIQTVQVNGKQEICDISRIVQKLNMKTELRNKK